MTDSEKVSKTHQPIILFAGGGSGGSFLPNVAIAQRLNDHHDTCQPLFLTSCRPLDIAYFQSQGLAYLPLPVLPLPAKQKPWQWPNWWRAWRASCQIVWQLVEKRHVVAVVSCGGFVAGPAMIVAQKRGIATVLVNLDAVPGKANRYLAKRCDRVFSVYDLAIDALRCKSPAAHIAMPIRKQVVLPNAISKAKARGALGLETGRKTLLVSGGSQGAANINDLMVWIAKHGWGDLPLAIQNSWQILHLAGAGHVQQVQRVYDQQQIHAKVLDFCDQMGQVWRAADLVITRAGAGNVGEVVANRLPAIYMPNPYHKDQHQHKNIASLLEKGACCEITDTRQAKQTASQLMPMLQKLLCEDNGRGQMAQNLARASEPDGAEAVARYLAQFA